jgi:hypothetical protein
MVAEHWFEQYEYRKRNGNPNVYDTLHGDRNGVGMYRHVKCINPSGAVKRR